MTILKYPAVSLLFCAFMVVESGAQSEPVFSDSTVDFDQVSAVVSGSASYVVESGDSLSGIARQFYGRGSLWPAILNENADLLDGEASAIRPGMELTIPSLDDALARRAETGTTSDGGAETDEGSGRWMYYEGTARAINREYMTFENAGRIAFVDPNFKEGGLVEAGQVIAYQDQRRPGAEVESANAQIVSAQTQLSVAQATQMEAAANLRLAQRTFERYSTLLQQNSASQQEYDEAEARLQSARAAALRADREIETAKAQISVAEAALGTANVTKDESYLIAPIAGVIARHNIEQGDYYTPQTIKTQTEQQLFDTIPVIIIDPSKFEITVKVPSKLFDKMAVGARALIDIVDPDSSLEERLPDEDAGPPRAPGDYEIQGAIYSISPVMDTDLRNFNVTVHTTAGHRRLRDGETVSLWIRTRSD